jgi:hypothetical protein
MASHLHAVYPNPRPTAEIVDIACIAKKIRMASRRFKLAPKIVALLVYSALDVVFDEPPLIQLASDVVTGPTFNQGISVTAAASVAIPSATTVSTKSTS